MKNRSRKAALWAAIITGIAIVIGAPLTAFTPAYALNETFRYTGAFEGDTPPNGIVVNGGSFNMPAQTLTRVDGTNDYSGVLTITKPNGARCAYNVTIDVNDGATTGGNLSYEMNNWQGPPDNPNSGVTNCGGNQVLAIGAVTIGGQQAVVCNQGETPAGDQCRSPVGANGECVIPGTTLVDPNLPGQPREEPYCVRGGAAAPGEPGAATQEVDNCPIAKNQEMRWAYCPLFNGLGLLTNTIDSFINEYLTTGNKIFATDKSTNSQAVDENGYQRAWQTFRNFGIALVVIAGLVMLVSEAFGLEFIDAYTVRRVLPRLLIAIVGISLSWELCKFLVSFFDTLGRAAGSIIYTSFNVGDAGIEIWPSIMIWLGGAAGVAYGALLLGGFGLLSMVGTLLLAMIVGAIVLILRQAIIIAAVIMAPLAIAAYILPNTNKLASFWWDTFIKMLMLYPIATGIIALCKVLGSITLNTTAGGERSGMGDLIAVVSGIIFFFAGYALLPVAFRLTGGLVATIGGLANDRSRGAFDRLKNYRGAKQEHNAAALKNGTRFANRSFTNPITGNSMSPGRRFNTISRGLATGGKGHFGVGARGAAAQHAAIETAANDVVKSAPFQAFSQHDEALKAATYDSAAQARAGMLADGYDSASIEAGINDVKASGMKFGDRTLQYASARQLVSTGTGFKSRKRADGTMMSGSDDMEATLARVSHGNNSQIGALAGFANSETKKVGRYDMAPSAGNLVNRVQQRAGTLPEGADPVSKNTAGVEAWKSGGLYNHANAKPESLKAHVQTFKNVIADPGATEADRRSAAVFMQELKAMRPNASGGVQTEIDKAWEDPHLRGLMDSTMVTYDATKNGGAGGYVPLTTRITVPDDHDPNKKVYKEVGVTYGNSSEVKSRVREYQRPDPNNM